MSDPDAPTPMTLTIEIAAGEALMNLIDALDPAGAQ